MAAALLSCNTNGLGIRRLAKTTGYPWVTRLEKRVEYDDDQDEYMANWQHRAGHLPRAARALGSARVSSTLVQTKGQRSHTRLVAWHFHVRSHYLLGQFLDEARAEDDGEARRLGHVFLRPDETTAVVLLTPLAFSRRGPRSEAFKINLSVKAGFCAVAGRPGGRDPDLRFDDGVSANDQKTHFGSRSRRAFTRSEIRHRG